LYEVVREYVIGFPPAPENSTTQIKIVQSGGVIKDAPADVTAVFA
jgi:hypothetical protein